MGERLKLLLVEDNLVDQMAFRRHVRLLNLPYDCTIVESIAAACELLAETQFDIVVTDYTLGDGTAEELLAHVTNAPAVAVTGSGDEHIAVQIMKAGVYDYLVKDPQGRHLVALPAVVDKAIQRWRAEQELKHYRERLEQLVEERTAELKAANEALQHEMSERLQVELDRQHLMFQLSAQAQEVQHIIETVPEGVLVLDEEQHVVMANPIAEEYLKVLADVSVGDILVELGGRPLGELLTSPPLGLRHEVAAGERHFSVIARPMEDVTTAPKWVLVVVDITQLRDTARRVQLQDRMAAVGQLAAGIAHDFRNIMAVVVLYLQMGMRMPNVPPAYRDKLQVALRESRRATDLIQQILDFGRQTPLERRPLNLADLLAEQIRLLERTMPENISISISSDRETYIVAADPVRMQQVFMNLAVNARDAMPDGGSLQFSIRQERFSQSKAAPLPGMQAGEWVIITVADDGAGIEPEILHRVFEPFFTTKPAGEGTGLGLAQVYGIVQQHDGFVDVQSKVGHGTRFILYFPSTKSDLGGAEPLAEVELVHGDGELILVVEDDPSLRDALAGTLQSLNYRVITAVNGQDALDQLFGDDAAQSDDVKVDLIVSDLVMPGMGGQALFRVLRQRQCMTPMILLTGHPLHTQLEQLESEGLAGWMSKPPQPDQLAVLIAQSLGR